MVTVLDDILDPPPSGAATTIGLNFTASELNVDSSFIPPDTIGAVGPNHIVEFINGRYDVYDKTTGTQVQTFTLDGFWQAAGATLVSGTFDPRMNYDRTVGRWFAASIDGATPNSLFVAVSQTSDPTGPWRSAQFIGDTLDGVRFNDYVTMSLDAEGVYFATNNFGGPSGFDVSVYSVPKVDLLLPVPSLARLTRFEARSSATYGASIQAVLDFGPADGIGTILGDSGGTLRRADIVNPGTAGATLGPASAVAGVPAFNGAPAARQPSGVTIENVSPRFTGNVVGVGGSIWAVHAVRGSFANSAIRWYEIDDATNSVVQTGLIESANLDYLDPSIAVNAFGNVLIGATQSGPTLFASAVAIVGQTVGGVTTFDPPRIVGAGVGNYFVDYGSGRNRWGDYSATVVDPIDPQTFWTFQEFVSGLEQMGCADHPDHDGERGTRRRGRPHRADRLERGRKFRADGDHGDRSPHGQYHQCLGRDGHFRSQRNHVQRRQHRNRHHHDSRRISLGHRHSDQRRSRRRDRRRRRS